MIFRAVYDRINVIIITKEGVKELTALKIIGIILSSILLLLILILLLRVRFIIKFKKGDSVKFAIGFLCFTFGGKEKKPAEEQKEAPKKEKKPSKLAEKLKKRLGLDIDLKEDAQNGEISNTVNKVITLLTLLSSQLKWLVKKLRIDLLRILIVCGGGDAADTAMDYGAVCAVVYPFFGYVTENLNLKKNAEELNIGCDFEGESHFEFDLTVSVRIFYLVKAALSGLLDMAENARIIEEATNEQQ